MPETIDSDEQMRAAVVSEMKRLGYRNISVSIRYEEERIVIVTRGQREAHPGVWVDGEPFRREKRTMAHRVKMLVPLIKKRLDFE